MMMLRMMMLRRRKMMMLRRRTGRPGLTLCASRMVEMHEDMSQEPLDVRILNKKAARQDRKPHFVRACASEMRMHMSEESFDGEDEDPDADFLRQNVRSTSTESFCAGIWKVKCQDRWGTGMKHRPLHLS